MRVAVRFGHEGAVIVTPEMTLESRRCSVVRLDHGYRLIHGV